MPKITSTARLADRPAPDGFVDGSVAWDVELRFQRRRMTIPFYMGPALCREPSTADVVECLAADASSADQPFEDWCGDYGYDPDSRKAFAIYEQVQRQTARLHRLLGGHYDDFVNAGPVYRSSDDGSVFI